MSARLLIACIAAALVAGAASCGGDCDSPTSPCSSAGTLTGRWSGTSDYINAPFTMDLKHVGASVTGRYEDSKDSGSVNGSVTDSSITMDVNFGDTGLRMTGTIESPSRITGTIRVPVLGNRTFSFQMTR